MPRNCRIQALRTTRAALDSNAGSSNLYQGEFYWITDEDILAVGKSASTYVDIGAIDDPLGFLDLTDPGADRIAFWDDSAGEMAWMSWSTDDFWLSPTGELRAGSNVAQFDAGGTLNDSWLLGPSGVLDINQGEMKLGSGGKFTVGPGGEITFEEGFNSATFDAIYDGAFFRPRWGSANIAYLTDPGADRLLMWDDSLGFGGQWAGCSLGTNLSFSGTTLNFDVSADIDMGTNHLFCDQRIAEHSGDINTYIEFSGPDQWSVTVGGTRMLEVGITGVDIDGHCRYRANVISVGTGTGTTAIGSSVTGNTYYATPTLFNSRSFRLDSATVGTQIEVHMNGAGTVQFTQGTGQTIIQGNNWKMVDGSAAKAICVATNTWSVVGENA